MTENENEADKKWHEQVAKLTKRLCEYQESDPVYRALQEKHKTPVASR